MAQTFGLSAVRSLEAAAEGGCEELLLGEAQITPQGRSCPVALIGASLCREGIRDIIAFMQDTPCRLCRVPKTRLA